MNMQARMLGESFFGVRMLVGGAVVAHQMQRFVLRRLPIDLTQKRGPLDMPMALFATPDDDLGRVYLGLASAARQILCDRLDSANCVPSTPTSRTSTCSARSKW